MSFHVSAAEIETWLGNWPGVRSPKKLAETFASNLIDDGIAPDLARAAMRRLRGQSVSSVQGPSWAEFRQCVSSEKAEFSGEQGPGYAVASYQITLAKLTIPNLTRYAENVAAGFADRGGGFEWSGDWSSLQGKPFALKWTRACGYADLVAERMRRTGFERDQLAVGCPGFIQFCWIVLGIDAWKLPQFEHFRPAGHGMGDGVQFEIPGGEDPFGDE